MCFSSFICLIREPSIDVHVVDCIIPKACMLMMLIVIAAAEMGITVIVVMLGQVRLAELEVLMGVGCIKRPFA